MAVLTADAVDAIFRECLFREGEPTEPRIEAEGIRMKVGFHPGRVAEAREAIRAFLSNLPEEFHADKGGGWSFLNACIDREGHQWGEHPNVEQLFLLGQAAGMATCQLPRKLWPALRGGMPYYVVDTTTEQPLA